MELFHSKNVSVMSTGISSHSEFNQIRVGKSPPELRDRIRATGAVLSVFMSWSSEGTYTVHDQV